MDTNKEKSYQLDKMWLKSYPKDVPMDIDPDHYPSLLELFEISVKRFSERPAYMNMGKTLTFQQLDIKSRAFAAYLQQELHLKSGERIALMLPNLLQYPIAFFGIVRAGLIVVNVNPLYTPRELTHQLKDSGAAAIIILENFAHTLEKVKDNSQLKHIIITKLGDEFSFIKGSMINFAIKFIKRLVPAFNLPNKLSYREVLNKGKQYHYVKPTVSNNDIALLQYTGGTTGIAKGAMLTHRNLQANLQQIKAGYQALIHPGQEVVLAALPFYHIFALMINCLLFLEQGGCNLLITNPRDIPGLMKELSRYPCTTVVGVNTLFNAMLNHDGFKDLNFSALRLAIGGGMAVQEQVANKWFQVTGGYLLEGYGLTECSPVVSACPHNLHRYNGSIGLPLPSTDIRIVDDNGKDVLQGEIGELWVKGPQVMLGYWQSIELTEHAFHDGWLATGDLVKIDKEGFLYLVDRKKDLILVSGFNVYPTEIEEVVISHPKVFEVAAIAIPSELSGEAVKICVVKKDLSLTKEELIEYCSANLTRYKVPKVIEFYDELPKSNVGKILRKELRKQA